ncbi:MAG TPA: xanthine dehydrogenase family protein subunit M [Syntrophorhabdales bacterium]|nr:xanthine dehydrogenase family protein subunit M [Syntrophorhabdales bacterium]
MLPAFDYVRPKSLPDVFKYLSRGARVQAGGTDLLGCLRDRVFQVSAVVSLSNVKELRGITETGSGLRIGALTTISEIAASQVIRSQYPALAQAAMEVASPQLRNQGTVGGNLCQKPRCWYYRGEFQCLRKGGQTCFAVVGENQYHCILGGDGCYIVHPSDTAPALIALGATLRVAGAAGTREVAIEEFFVPPAKDPTRETILEPGEIITDILLAPPQKGLRSSYRKVRARRSWDFALASLALAVSLTGGRVTTARVLLGGAAPVPWRSRETEELITGKQLDAATIEKAARTAINKAQPMEHNEYKLALFRGLIEEQLQAIRAT